MKLLFVTVVVFVMVSVAFADDVVWEIAPPFSLMPGSSSPEGSETTEDSMTNNKEEKDQAQAPQQNAVTAPILSTEPETKRVQAADQKTNGDVHPDKQAQGVGDMFWTIFWIVVVFVLPVSFFVANYLQKGKADTLAEQHRERTDRITQITTRAYVEVEGWKIDDLGDDRGQRWITFSLANKGKAPATILTTAANYYLKEERDVLPPPFNPEQGPLDTVKAETLLHASDPPLEWSVLIPSGTALRKDIENHRVTLYAFFYIAYDDGLGQKREVCTFVKYNFLLGWEFIPIGGSEYNYRT